MPQKSSKHFLISIFFPCPTPPLGTSCLEQWGPIFYNFVVKNVFCQYLYTKYPYKIRILVCFRSPLSISWFPFSSTWGGGTPPSLTHPPLATSCLEQGLRPCLWQFTPPLRPNPGSATDMSTCVVTSQLAHNQRWLTQCLTTGWEIEKPKYTLVNECLNADFNNHRLTKLRLHYRSRVGKIVYIYDVTHRTTSQLGVAKALELTWNSIWPPSSTVKYHVYVEISQLILFGIPWFKVITIYFQGQGIHCKWVWFDIDCFNYYIYSNK